MNTKAKKLLSLLLSVAILLGCFSVCFTAFAAVAVSEANFPDPVFRQIITDKYGAEIDNTEIKDTTVLSLSGRIDADQAIKNLKGIEVFADSLMVLRCGGIGLEELDVSELSSLTSLSCQGNNLTSLDVSANTNLITLNCSDNANMTSLTVGELYDLQTLHCYANSLTDIDVSQAPNLIDFRCDQNELTSLDVSNNVLLEEFTCSMNHLASLDLSKNTALGAVVTPSIGDQTTTAKAQISGIEISIPYAVDDEACVTSSSLGDEGETAYGSSHFWAQDVTEFENGIDYTYSVSLENSQDMTVHIDVTRDFYQVRYYTDSSMQQMLTRKLVTANANASNPIFTPPEPCMVADSWSDDLTSITADKDVYATWSIKHSHAVSAFQNGVATITCPKCGDSYTVVFKDCINSKSTDSNYCEYLDVVKDGWINAKDFAKLEKMF